MATIHTRSAAPSPFLMKTYELVEDKDTDEVISWNETGTTFVVWKSAEFSTELLPTYFKHNNFSSFVRQLNTYGFRKIVPGRWEFANEFFKRGHKDLLSEIHRRKSIPAAPPSTPLQVPSSGTTTTMNNINPKGDNSIHPSSSAFSNHLGEEDHLGSTSTTTTSTSFLDNKVELQGTTTILDKATPAMTHDMSNLMCENEKLRKNNKILSSKLARIKKQCEDLMSFLSSCNHDVVKLNNLVDMVQGVGGRELIIPDPPTSSVDICCSTTHDQQDNNIDDHDKKEECLKLFGVWLKGNKKKRGRDDPDT